MANKISDRHSLNKPTVIEVKDSGLVCTRKSYEIVIFYQGIIYKVNVHEQKENADYSVRGYVHAISPTDAKPVKIEGKILEKTFFLHEMDKEKAVEAAIKTVCAVFAVCAKPLQALLCKGDASITEKTESAFFRYGKRFLNAKTLAESTYRKKEKKLNFICSYFRSYEMGMVAPKDIREFLNNVSKSQAEGLLRVAADFWEFCRNEGFYTGSNPFSEYRNTHRKSKAPKMDHMRQYMELPKTLSDEQCKQLEEMIACEIDDGRKMGVLLVYQHGLSVDMACELKWKDVIWPTDNCPFARIRINKDFPSSKIQEYTFPCTVFEQQMLERRHRLLSKEIPERILKDLYIVSTAKNARHRYSTKDLKNHIREILIQLGVPRAAVTSTRACRAAFGVKLLLDNRRNRLISDCGVDEATLAFLTFKPIVGMTEGVYYTFHTDNSQKLLYLYLKRGDRSAANKDDPEEKSVIRSESQTVVPKAGSQQIAKLHAVIRLKPGERIAVSASAGEVRGEIRVRAIEDGQRVPLENLTVKRI